MRSRLAHSPLDASLPRAVVLLAVRGCDEGLDQNLAALTSQRYPIYRLVLATDHAATETKLREVTRGAAVPVELVESSLLPDCGAKIANLLAGVSRLKPDDEVLVFTDSDARPDSVWLCHLVGALALRRSGATTGYRWYFPEGFHLPTLLRSMWNATLLGLLGANEKTNFAWGGSVAMRRTDFESLQIAQRWRYALSDDYTITRTVHAADQGIEFVPQCLVPSFGRCSWQELLGWSMRQIRITRIYWPALWKMALASHTLFATSFFGGLAYVLWAGSQSGPARWTTLFLILIYTLCCLKAASRWNAVMAMLPQWSHGLARYRWLYVLLSPLPSLISVQALWRSALSREIVWRGIRYRLEDPDRVVVLEVGEADCK